MHTRKEILDAFDLLLQDYIWEALYYSKMFAVDFSFSNQLMAKKALEQAFLILRFSEGEIPDLLILASQESKQRIPYYKDAVLTFGLTRFFRKLQRESLKRICKKPTMSPCCGEASVVLYPYHRICEV